MPYIIIQIYFTSKINGLQTPLIFHCSCVIYRTFSESLRIIVSSRCVYLNTGRQGNYSHTRTTTAMVLSPPTVSFHKAADFLAQNFPLLAFSCFAYKIPSFEQVPQGLQMLSSLKSLKIQNTPWNRYHFRSCNYKKNGFLIKL